MSDSSVLYFDISNDPNRCASLRAQPKDQPEEAIIIAFYVGRLGQSGRRELPAELGLYEYPDPGALRPSNTLYWSTLSWRKPRDILAALAASRYETGGTVLFEGLDAAKWSEAWAF